MGFSPWGRKESDTTERLNVNNLLRGYLPYLVMLTKVSSRALSLKKGPFGYLVLEVNIDLSHIIIITSVVLE